MKILKNIKSLSGSILVLGAASLIAGNVMAVPDKPINAAQVQTKGDRVDIGCIVRASEDDPYMLDPGCNSHVVIKFERNGAPRFYRYQDAGELQVGQEAPARTVRIPIQYTDIFGGDCVGTEVVTPSGQYSSNLNCEY